MENLRSAQQMQAITPQHTPSRQRQGSRGNSDAHITTDPASPILSRRTSHDSDRTSTTASGITGHFPNNPIHVSPAPAYVGYAGASQAVSELQISKHHPASDSEDQDFPSDLRFSDPALALINAFLDQLLYSFLSSARSTSLPALRPAVVDVLKHRLAKEATNNADAELSELLGGAEDEEEMDSEHTSQDSKRNWDLELVWKRTRLRVMVYIRLGEMEDEDEQRYVERDELFHGTERSFSSTSGLVAWSAAIFLTSVLEYVAEQCLQVAGQAAHNRARRESQPRPSTLGAGERADRDIIVEEHDVEKIALNPSLGRLWRTWRKALRNQGGAVRPSSSSYGHATRDNMSRASQHTDVPINDSRPMSRDQHDYIPEAEYSEHILAANIPLPMSSTGRDLDEIAAVGLAKDPEEEIDEANDVSDYPEHVIAPLVPLPLHSEQRDLDELLVPGLAKDPDAEVESDHLCNEPYPALALALLVALPSLDLKRDVDEIEIPGLAKDPDAADKATAPKARRRDSFTGLANSKESGGLHAPALSTARSTSLPPASRLPMHADESEVEESPKERPEESDSAAHKIATTDSDTLAQLEAHQAKDEHTEGSEKMAQKATIPGDAVVQTPSHAVGTEAALAGASAVAVGAVATAAAALPSKVPANDEAQSSNQQFEEATDKRKSLVDLKSILVNKDMDSTNGIQQNQRREELQVPAISTTPSDDSYDLVDGVRKRSPAGAAETNGIKTARTSSLLATEHATADPVTIQRAREPAKRPAVLNLNEPTRRYEDSDMQSPRTPRTFLDLTEDQDEEDEDHGDVKESEKRRTSQPLADRAVAPTPSVAKTSPKEVSSLRFGSSRSSPQQKHSFDSSGVQEHPVVQKMASLKGKEASLSSASGSETALPLTAAAIRGPADFDSFVQGGETLKYTLTPEGVRDVPIDNVVQYSVAQQSPVELDGTPVRPKDVRSSADSRTGTTRVSVLRDAPTPASEGRSSSSEMYKSLNRPSPRNAAVGSRNGLLAREPRVLTESTRDIADFIRSTGPNGASMATPVAVGAAPSLGRSANSPNPYSISRTSPVSSRAKSSLQPRGAKVETAGSADLIDFIRSGPSEAGQHRIPRTVAPFRTTMDSGDFSNLNVRQSADTPAQSVLSASSQYASSLRTSTNSRSALLNGTGTSINATAPLSTNGNSYGPRGVLPDPEPAGRKQYRNKDPYAIDFDNDLGLLDDDDFLASFTSSPKKSLSTPKGHQKEESMFDFLRNHEPTPTGPPQPLIDPNSAQARRLIQEARERARNPSAAARSSILPRESPTPARAPTPQYAGTYQPRRPRMEARSPVTQGVGADASATNDLANFLRSSGPLDGGRGAPSPIVGPGPGAGKAGKGAKGPSPASVTKKKGGLFGLPKRKTYLDLP